MSLIKEEKLNSEKYKLLEEEIEYNNKKVKIVKLTSDNVSRVEAMISTDSDYKQTQIGEDGIVYKQDGTIKYIGSSRYWILQLKEIIDTDLKCSSKGFSYEDIIGNIIIAVDNENSTHLNSDKMGKNAVRDRIISLSRLEFKKLLKDETKEYKLLNYIQTPQHKGEKNHFAFATKFCHYVSLIIFEGTEFEDNYWIYDNVLKKSLCKYIKRYLNLDIEEDSFENDYKKYIGYIDSIRNKAEELYGKKISRNGFDHLLWYYHKGR